MVSYNSGWRAGAVRTPTDPTVIKRLEQLYHAFPAALTHQKSFAALGSQFVYSKFDNRQNFEDCGIALVRLSGAIENAFGITREVMVYYSPYPEFQIRTFQAAQSALATLHREATPDIIFFWSADPLLKTKLDDWAGSGLLAIPIDIGSDEDPVAVINLLRKHIHSRDLYYETTPVLGGNFFGRRLLLQSLRDDIQNQRIAGLYGLRKAGKTSVLKQLQSTMASEFRILILRDLETLPSPPVDPIPDLVQDLITDITASIRQRTHRKCALGELSESPTLPQFKRAMQLDLQYLKSRGISLAVLLDEIEFLTPTGVNNGLDTGLASIPQFFGVLRSLVQENPNFTFVLSGLTSSITQSGRLHGRPNPLFSVSKSHFLSPFEKFEADDLAVSLGRKMGIEIDDEALQALFDATGGHAFLYRSLASAAVQRLPLDLHRRRITRVEVLHSLTKWKRSIAGNIDEMIDHINRYYDDESLLLEAIQGNVDDFAQLAEIAPVALQNLIQLGLVIEIGRAFEPTPILQLR